MTVTCKSCGQQQGHGYGCAVLLPRLSSIETEQALERALVDAAIAHVWAHRRVGEALARDVDPYWDVKVSDAVRARDDARAAVERAVDAVIAQRMGGGTE